MRHERRIMSALLKQPLDKKVVLAKAVLNAPRDMLIEKADLEEETVDHVLKVLRAEFEQ